MREAEFEGVKYQIGRLNAIKQFHLARRLAPIIAGLAKASKDLPAPPENGASSEQAETKRADLFFEAISGPLAESFSAMTDVDAEYIINTCLAVVTRQDKGGWAPMLSRGGQMMYDIEMGTMLNLTFQVLQENLAGFFSGDRQESPAPARAATSN